MAKLTRYLQKIFANNSNQVGVFGTGVNKETSKNVETLQSADYEDGWSSAIITNKNYPIWQEMDGVQYGLSYQLKYLFQNGIPEWLSTETYYTNSYCRVGSTIYYSLQDNNTNHSPISSPDYWTAVKADINNKITNCILEIPQDIKLELNSGTLTLKSGSKVYVPNGFEQDGTTPKFDALTITNDLTLTDTWGSVTQLAIAVESETTTLKRTALERLTSGTTAPTETNYRWWYDTSANKIKEYSSGAWNNKTLSFPIAIVSVPGDNTASVNSIDTVFNGTGYIGTIFYTLPNVKVLMPDGRNTDGTLKNIEYTTQKVITKNDLYGRETHYILIQNDGNMSYQQRARYLVGLDCDKPTTLPNTYFWTYYATDTNKYYHTSGSTTANWVQRYSAIVARTIGDGTNMTGYVPKQATSLVDYNSLTDVQCVVQTYVNGSSWYRIYSDGWCEQGGIATGLSTNATNEVSLLKSYINTNYVVIANGNTTSQTGSSGVDVIHSAAKTTSKFNITHDFTGNYQVNKANWYACGYIS